MQSIQQKADRIPLQEVKLTARLRRRWVSLNSSLHLFLMLILLIFPLYKHISPMKSRLRNRLRKSIMVRLCLRTRRIRSSIDRDVELDLLYDLGAEDNEVADYIPECRNQLVIFSCVVFPGLPRPMV